MTNVVGFTGQVVPQIGTPNAGLVSMLEDLTAMARDGRLQSLIATGFEAGGDRMTAMGGHHGNLAEMVGAICLLQGEYLAKYA